ncbi:MAG: metallophosphoesterase [Deltaproteobacteria bacterium]|nr:metallophosphoesterase [Deltaproteobacteria bacterium]
MADSTAPASAFIVLPDTQFYSCYYEEIFQKQTTWIVNNRSALGVALVLHVGDIVDSDQSDQWDVASEALHRLDGRVPYLLVTGNHDLNAERESLLNDYFTREDLEKNARVKLSFKEPGHIENAYALVELRGSPWLFIGIEFAPRDETLEWANRVLRENSEIPAVVFTHAYLYSDNTRFDREIEPLQPSHPDSYQVTPDQGIADGQDVWERLVEPNENVRLVLCGHVTPDGVARSEALHPSGRVVHEVLANYQRCVLCPCHEVEGGGGYLRIYELDKDAESFHVFTYSPFYESFLNDSDNAFELRL